MSALGDFAWSAVVIALNVAVVAAWVAHVRRGQGPLVIERQRAAWRTPAFRTLVIVWTTVLVAGTVLVMLAAKASS